MTIYFELLEYKPKELEKYTRVYSDDIQDIFNWLKNNPTIEIIHSSCVSYHDNEITYKIVGLDKSESLS